MEKVKIKGRHYLVGGKIRGQQKNKWNRAAKLAYRFDELDKKFRCIVDRGNAYTEHARCALALLLMMHTGIRVGNEGSAEGYMTVPHPHSKKKPEFVKTYGLTTLLKQHFVIGRKSVKISFVGKKQVDNYFTITDPQLVTQLKFMFLYSQTDTAFGITDYMLTKFIKKYVGKGFSPKDFRCMRANLYAWEVAADLSWDEMETKKEFRESLKVVFCAVSEKLNNTPGVCKKSYVCPELSVHLEDIYENN